MNKIITRAWWTFNIIETIQHDLVHDKTAKKKKARIEARFGALEHDLMQSDARQAVKKSTRWHDLVRWGTISCTTSRRKRKSMHWSTIWYATNREKKNALEQSKIWCTTNREKKQQYNSSSSIAANLANQSVDEV